MPPIENCAEAPIESGIMPEIVLAVVLIPKMASQEAFPHYRFPNSQFPIKSQAIAKPLIPDSQLGPKIMQNH